MPERRGTVMYLRDIIEAMDDIESFVEGMTFDEFKGDKRTFAACVRNLSIMGEAVKNLPENLKDEHDDIPWREVAGMRDKVIHAYFGVSHEIIWKTIHTRFEEFRKSIEGILSELE
jgi:uncharacterized protein with HEPN domain